MHRRRRILPRDYAPASQLTNSRCPIQATLKSLCSTPGVAGGGREKQQQEKSTKNGLGARWLCNGTVVARMQNWGDSGEREERHGVGIYQIRAVPQFSRRYCNETKFSPKSNFLKGRESPCRSSPWQQMTETQQAPLLSTGRQSHDLVPAPGAWHSV